MRYKINQELGRLGEKLAGDFLNAKGFCVLKENYRQSCGEIDLICLDEEEIVFVEVKTRSNLRYGVPELAVDQKKLMKIIETGFEFLKENEFEDRPWRVDVISILISKYDDEPQITHYEGIRIDG